MIRTALLLLIFPFSAVSQTSQHEPYEILNFLLRYEGAEWLYKNIAHQELVDITDSLRYAETISGDKRIEFSPASRASLLAQLKSAPVSWNSQDIRIAQLTETDSAIAIFHAFHEMVASCQNKNDVSSSSLKTKSMEYNIKSYAFSYPLFSAITKRWMIYRRYNSTLITNGELKLSGGEGGIFIVERKDNAWSVVEYLSLVIQD